MRTPLRTAALLLVLAPVLSGCAGSGDPGGAAEGRPAARRRPGTDPEAERREAAAEARRDAEKRAQLGKRASTDRHVEVSTLSEAEVGEFRRAWRMFLEYDPRWARARTDWLAKGGAAPYVLSENLFRYFWSASTLQKKDEVLRVGREAAHVGEPAVGYFADLLVLESWPLREAKTTNMFDPETGKPTETTVTHLAVDDVSRQNAALVLAAIGPPAVPTLASPAVLKAAAGSSRTYAAYALGKIGDDAAVAALSEVLRSSPDWKDRGAAAKGLGFALTKNPAARAPLEAALQDPDRFVRKKAEDALAGKGSLEF